MILTTRAFLEIHAHFLYLVDAAMTIRALLISVKGLEVLVIVTSLASFVVVSITPCMGIVTIRAWFVFIVRWGMILFATRGNYRTRQISLAPIVTFHAFVPVDMTFDIVGVIISKVVNVNLFSGPYYHCIQFSIDAGAIVAITAGESLVDMGLHHFICPGVFIRIMVWLMSVAHLSTEIRAFRKPDNSRGQDKYGPDHKEQGKADIQCAAILFCFLSTYNTAYLENKDRPQNGNEQKYTQRK